MTASKTKIQRIRIGNEVLKVTVRESDRSRVRLVVQPSGDIEARVPIDTAETWLANFIRRRARWIFRQLDYFKSFRPRDPEQHYRNGETIRYLGRQYRLKVIDGDASSAKLKGRFLVIAVPESRSVDVVRQLVQAWYRTRAEVVISGRVSECMKIMAPHGLSQPSVQLRKMKRRWGSCSPSGRILFNPNLVIAPLDCIDYVIVHELCHLKHAYHDRAFYRFLATVMPDWQRRRRRLEELGKHLAL